ncbi:MAG: hypothetical protein EOM14_11245 [Clostridia bacterium]|nr:hypothetical protein [Clostridia bacterium]
MPGKYAEDREWSDLYLPAVKRIIGPLLLEETSFEVDTRQAADLIVLKARHMMIAARVRRFGYADRYPWEFTIRSHRDSGAKTELQKIVDGFGDWMFYGHAGIMPGEIDRWFVIDLAKFRAGLIRNPCTDGKEIWWGEKSNQDGTHFCWFDVRKFPEDILVNASHSHLIEAAS